MKQKRGPQGPKKLPSTEATITSLTDDGIGLAPVGGKELLVSGALPGEKVVATIEHEGQRRLVGRLVRVLEPAAERRPSPCRIARRCQGCPLIAMRYGAQLSYKEQRVRQALQRYPSLAGVRHLPIWGAPEPLGYRTSAKLAIGKTRGKVQIGLYQRGSHDVIDIADCPQHHPLINRIAAVVREEVERQGIFVYNPQRNRGLMRYLTVRVAPASGKAMVCFVTTERNFREIPRLGKWLQRKLPEVVSIHQNVNSSSGNVIWGRETVKLLGHPDLIDTVGEVRLRVGPTSFSQVNNAQAGRIYKLVRSWAALEKSETALDLYCGIGGIALHLARDAGRVHGIEVIEEAVRNARDNARMNGLNNCSFSAGDAAELIEDLALEPTRPDVAVVNPPRSGCAPEVLEALTALGPRALIYVSCNPTSLARDLDLLQSLGYRTEEVQPVDMFPQTAHVETVARLVPAKGPKA